MKMRRPAAGAALGTAPRRRAPAPEADPRTARMYLGARHIAAADAAGRQAGALVLKSGVPVSSRTEVMRRQAALRCSRFQDMDALLAVTGCPQIPVPGWKRRRSVPTISRSRDVGPVEALSGPVDVGIVGSSVGPILSSPEPAIERFWLGQRCDQRKRLAASRAVLTSDRQWISHGE